MDDVDNFTEFGNRIGKPTGRALNGRFGLRKRFVVR
jgi:hypothetical protein